MKLIFTNFSKFNFWNINLKEIQFPNFWKMQNNAIFIFQKINFLNYTFHTWIISNFAFQFIKKKLKWNLRYMDWFSIESFRKSIWVDNLHLGNLDVSATDLVFLSLLFKHLEKLSLRFFQHLFKNSFKNKKVRLIKE